MSSRRLTFQSRMERIAPGINYFHVPVPAKITQALGTRAAVPVTVRIDGSAEFRGSLYPMGGGRHALRVKASVRKAAEIEEGDRLRIEISVVDRAAEITIPRDLAAQLRAKNLLAAFRSLTPGRLGFILRRIEAAAKPETREKRIEEAVQAALARGKR